MTGTETGQNLPHVFPTPGCPVRYSPVWGGQPCPEALLTPQALFCSPPWQRPPHPPHTPLPQKDQGWKPSSRKSPLPTSTLLLTLPPATSAPLLPSHPSEDSQCHLLAHLHGNSFPSGGWFWERRLLGNVVFCHGPGLGPEDPLW